MTCFLLMKTLLTLFPPPNNLPKFDMSDTPILEGEILDCIKSLEDKKNSGHDGFFYTSP